MIHGIILAAGSSSRFGENKLLFLLHGKPLILHTLEKFKPVIDNLHVVVNDIDSTLAKFIIESGYNIIACPESHLGLGNSLACGVRAIPHADGWIVSLADMPFIQQNTISRVHSALLEGHLIVVPCHNKQRGHPVGFHNNLFDELSHLSGEIGGKKIIQENQENLYQININDPGILKDIDMKSDLFS